MLLPSSPSSTSFRQGQIPMFSALGHGMCQNTMTVAAGRRLRIMAGRQGEVIILHQDDRVFGIHLAEDRVGEFLVHGLVLAPILGAEDGPGVRHVAERPQPFVREAVVVALLFFLGEPHTPNQIRFFAGRHQYVIFAIDRIAIGGAAAVSHPDTGTGAHHGLERGHESARRVLNFHRSFAGVLMNVGFAVGEDDHLLAVKIPVEALLQALRGPLAGRIVAIVRHPADQFADVAENGLKLAAVLAATAQQAAQFAAPVIARSLGRPDGHTERSKAENAEGDDQKSARLRFAAIDETEIVQENCKAEFLPLVGDRHDAHMHPAGGQRGDGAPFMEVGGAVGIQRSNPAAHRPTTELLGKPDGGSARFQIRIADRGAHHAFVARECGDLLLKLRGFAIPAVRQRFFDAHEHQIGT